MIRPREHVGGGVLTALTGALAPDEVGACLEDALRGSALPWHVTTTTSGDVEVSGTEGVVLALRAIDLEAPAPRVLDASSSPPVRSWVVCAAPDASGTALAELVVPVLRERFAVHTPAEVAAIEAAMPLLFGYATADEDFANWSLVFRDHFVENSVGFVLAALRCGVPPQHVLALSKGDRTAHRDRVAATLRHHGVTAAVLDNSFVDGTATADELDAARLSLRATEDFIARAHDEGRRVLVVDDGGLLAMGFGGGGLSDGRVDAAVELTVSGLKRIAAVPGGVSVPVFNMARSQLKKTVAYNEIADSCLRRVRDLLPAEKFVGRQVLCVGYGTLGRRVAHGLRALGCRVCVVDTDVLTLISAAEEGFDTRRDTTTAIADLAPFLVLCSTGEHVMTDEALAALPGGTLLAGFATRDLSGLVASSERTEEVPGFGVRFTLPGGRVVTRLGDGRSLNLFEYEGIANRGYDAYRAATLLTCREMCRTADALGPGVHEVDDVVARSGLYERYYDLYLAGGYHG
jgi:adenosylhomocysteinase